MNDIVQKDGKQFVLVPLETYRRMIDELDELDDIRGYDRAKAEAGEFVPAAIADRLIAGENPLRVWREHRGLTQQQLAAKAGLSKPYVSQLEAGIREPSIGSLQRLAAALEIDIDDLVGNAEGSAPTKPQRARP